MIPFNNTFAKLPEQFYSKQDPAQVPQAKLIAINDELALELGIDPDWLKSDEGIAVISGNQVAEGSEPLAQAYAGHQFGGFSPQLGDGRALLLGEVIDTHGLRKDIQLKGSGSTYFSRRGDGKSALGPVIREYLMSEAMHALGIPTTRALAAVTTGEKVVREELLDGGIFTRVAASHIRIGTFQFFAAQQDHDSVKTLLDYTIQRHYPEASQSNNPALEFLKQVIASQAKLISQWMAVGFIHGVMNTDNSAISGETIDFGPCAMMDEFHPQCVFSSIDRDARYSWGNQPSIAHWNLSRLAETLLPLISSDIEEAQLIAKSALDEFSKIFVDHYHRAFCAKLAVPTETSPEFIRETLTLLANHRIDFTHFFRHLTSSVRDGDHSALQGLFSDQVAFEAWYADWSAKLDRGLLAIMQQSNPVLIPRNHLVERAIQAVNSGDFSVFHRLKDAWKTPYQDLKENSDLEAAPTAEEKVWETFCGT